MARAVVLSLSLAASSANNIALNQVPVSGTALTLNGAAVTGGVATLDNQRRILLTFGNEAQNRTMVITGTNQAGVTISETLAVASGAGGTVATNQDFFTVTSAVPAGGGWTAGVTLGTNTVGSTPWQLPNQHITPFNLDFWIEIATTAVVNATLEATYDSILAPISIYSAGFSTAPPVPVSFDVPGLSGVVASASGNVNMPIAGWRLTINSGTDKVIATGSQAGIRN